MQILDAPPPSSSSDLGHVQEERIDVILLVLVVAPDTWTTRGATTIATTTAATIDGVVDRPTVVVPDRGAGCDYHLRRLGLGMVAGT